jgi:hypothetical protein
MEGKSKEMKIERARMSGPNKFVGDTIKKKTYQRQQHSIQTVSSMDLCSLTIGAGISIHGTRGVRSAGIQGSGGRPVLVNDHLRGEISITNQLVL